MYQREHIHALNQPAQVVARNKTKGIKMVPSGEYFDGESGTGNTPGCAAFVVAAALLVFVVMLADRVKEQKSQIQRMPRQEIRNDVDTVKMRNLMNTHQIQIFQDTTKSK